MNQESDIRFFQKLMQNYHLQTLRFPAGEIPEVDLGLRRMLGLKPPSASIFAHFKAKIIYYADDAFDCSYTCMLLPGGEEIFLVGPYLRQEKSDTDIMTLLEKHQLPPSLFRTLRQYYSSLTLTGTERLMLVAVSTLGEALWGDMQAFSMQYVDNWEKPDLLYPLPPTVEQGGEEMDIRLVEARYEGERELLNAVAHGMHHQAQMIISQWRSDMMEIRAADPVRNLRNYAIVLNTLLRKAVEQGNVHPVHIDRLSSAMAKKIEQFHNLSDGSDLLQSMVHKYCLLVRNHSMKHYSKLVQHVILRIETDLTADLSLKAHAEQFNVNASYLSALFKKETGVTLTDYVNRMRIDHAIFLLNVTDMQIQTIAQYCGIPDVNYFTKLFKRTVGKTPKEYRQETRG